MMNFRGLRLLAGPVLAAALVAPLSGCGEDGGVPGLECELQAKIDNLNASVNTFIQISEDIRADLYVACATIAEAGGNTDYDPAATDVSDDDLSGACGAVGELKATLEAEANLSIDVVFPECSVNVEAQANCEANCQVDASCEEPSLEARCEGGTLKGKCEGECTGSIECTAEAGATVECSGECSGTCEGTCDGTCSVENTDGSCAGQCEGTCEGSCGGSCKAEATAEASCSGEAKCEGSCSVEMEAPQCSVDIQPPNCEVDADCSADCDASASAEAECTPPAVVITADASADADLIAAFEANFGVIAQIALRGEDLINAFGDIAASVQGVASAGGKCTAAVAASLGAKVQGMVDACASVNVSVSASASASGEAG